MEFIQAVLKRSSVRNFTDEKIPIEILKEMVSVASMAPCISGKEIWKFIAITNKELIKKLSDSVKQKYEDILPKNDERLTESTKYAVEMFSSVFLKAPVVIAVLAEPYTAIIDKVLSDTAFTHEEINKMRNHPDIQTIGAAIQNLLLSAVDLGYGACWLTGPMVAKEELGNLIGVKEPYSLIAFVAVGKPDKEVTPRMRKPVDDIFEVIE